jgi:hypothetical protein
MSVHIHTLRNCCASVLALIPAPLVLSWALAPTPADFGLAQVSGRVTCGDEPFSGVIHFVPNHPSGVSSIGLVNPDGSFQLYANAQKDRRGALPGTYRVVVYPRSRDKTGARLDTKYQDARTTDLMIDVGPDWNYVCLNLH